MIVDENESSRLTVLVTVVELAAVVTTAACVVAAGVGAAVDAL